MPIQLIDAPNNSGAGSAGIQQFTNVLQEMAQRKQQEQQQAAEMMIRRQQFEAQQAEHQRQLREAAINEFMANKDNPEMANLVAQKHGFSLENLANRQTPTGLSSMAQQAPAPATPPAPAAPMPNSMETQDLMDINMGQPPGMPTVKVKDPTVINAGPEVPTVHVSEPTVIQAGPHHQEHTPEQEHMDYAYQLLTHDDAVSKGVDRVNQFKEAEQLAQQGGIPPAPSPVYRLNFPGGAPVTVDTGALRAGEESEKSRRLSEFKGEVGGDPEAMKLVSMMVNLGQPDAAIAKALVDTGKLSINNEERLRRLELSLAGRKDIEGAKEESKLGLEHLQQAGGKYQGGMGAAGATGFNVRQERANMAAHKEAVATTNQWALRSGLNALAKGATGLDEVKQQIAANNPTSTAAALERFVAISRSGTGQSAAATNAALSLFQKHLSGTYGSIEGAIERIKNGDFGPEQKRNLSAAVSAAENSMRQSAAPLHEQYVKGFYTPGRAMQKGTIEDQEENLFGALGYHPRYDPNAMTIVPASGQAPAPSGRSSAPSSKGGGPTVTPKDREMRQKAVDAINNPSTPPAVKANAQRLIDTIDRDAENMTFR